MAEQNDGDTKKTSSSPAQRKIKCVKQLVPTIIEYSITLKREVVHKGVMEIFGRGIEDMQFNKSSRPEATPNRSQAKKKTLMNSARANCSTDALAIKAIISAPSVHSFKFKKMNQDDAPPAPAMMTQRRNSTGISSSI